MILGVSGKMIFIAIVSCLIGLFLIDYNQNNKAKHYILIGIFGYVLTLIVPLGIVGYKFF